MSHFSVAVITKTPDPEELRLMLQPYHEFECTGRDDEYVVDVDQTEDHREEFERYTNTMLKGPAGELVSAYDDQFYRDPTPEEQKKIGTLAGTGAGHGMSWTSRDWSDGRGYRTKVRFVPDGWEQVEVKASETQGFVEFIDDWSGKKPWKTGTPKTNEHKYGWVEVDDAGNAVKVVYRTNPNKQWDWWQVGGRFSGMLDACYDPQTDPRNIECCFICRGSGMRDDDLGRKARAENPEYKCNGCNGTGKAVKWPTVWVNDIGNKAQVKLISVEGLRAKVKEAAGEQWDANKTKVETKPDAFNEYWDGVDPRKITREDHVAQAGRLPFSTFAILDEKGWHEKGSMGWWGLVSDEKNEWPETYAKFLDDLFANHGEKWITIVDCHV